MIFDSKKSEQMPPETVLYGKSTSAASSFTKLPEIQPQISSVDFATLSKQNTNSSNGSSLRTSASHKVSLTRLFSRRKASSETLQLHSKESYHGDSDSINPQEMEKPQGIREKFKGSISPRIRSKFEKNLMDKSDLRNQASGQHRSSLSKSSYSQPFNREGTANESFQNPPAHQNGSNKRPSVEYKGHISIDQRDAYQTGSGIMPRRTIIQLSSQSSNSVINDRVAASTYNFTNPNHNGTLDSSIHDSRTLLELHRRYMVSADLYIQKLHKIGPENTTASASILSTKKETLRKGLQIYDEHYNEAFSELYEIVKPILYFGSKNNMRTHNVLSIEEVASFVEERLLVARNVLGSLEKDRHSYTKLGGEFGPTNLLSSDEAEDEMRELESKEFLSKISSFFSKCCLTLAENSIGNKIIDCDQKISGVKFSNNEFRDRKIPYSTYLENWLKIARAWDYFNSRVRFFVLHILLPAELQLDFVHSKDSNHEGSSASTNLEKDLLHAFRDAFIIPQLRTRMILISGQESEPYLPENPLLLEEKNIFADKKSYSKSLINCFGVLSSYVRRDFLTSEDSQPDDMLFSDFMRCLKLYSH